MFDNLQDFQCFTNYFTIISQYFTQKTTNSSSFAPIPIFHVESGLRYRFRIINSGLNVCPFLMQIEDHELTIIATEVSYVKPQKINTLYFMAGERYDFIVDTKNKTVRDYFIRIRQLIPCHQELQGFAVLRYHQKGSDEPRPVIQFDNRTIPTFAQEYPNGTVS